MAAKKFFDSYHATKEEIIALRTVLETTDLDYYETQKGNWGTGSAGFWVKDSADYQRARDIVITFNESWLEQVRQQRKTTFNWSGIPILILVFLIAGWLTFSWYF